jgi:hypothetical protein
MSATVLTVRSKGGVLLNLTFLDNESPQNTIELGSMGVKAMAFACHSTLRFQEVANRYTTYSQSRTDTYPID